MIVLGMLLIFGILGISFTMSMRLEETTSVAYKWYVLARDVADAAVKVAQDELDKDKNGDDGIPYSGDEGFRNGERLETDILSSNYSVSQGYTGPYDSKAERWYTGFHGKVGNNRYDLRRFNVNKKDGTWHFLGIDEDPPGDVSRDGAPGYAGVDDDVDGLVDEDRFGEPQHYANGNVNDLFVEEFIEDDDEDEE